MVCLALIFGSLGILQDLQARKYLSGLTPEDTVCYRWGRGEGASADKLYRISGAAQPETAVKPLPEKMKPFFSYPMDLNRVSAALLQTVPGIGTTLAGRIVLSRQRQGAYQNLDELGRVAGIGQTKLASLKPFLTTDPAPTFLLQRNFSYPAVISHSVQD